MPKIPFVETETQDDFSIDLQTGNSLDEFGMWYDARYCRCGRKLDFATDNENSVTEKKYGYLCPDCAAEDRVNVCSLTGVPGFITTKGILQCSRDCYKYLSNCAAGYCVYLAILSPTPAEVKVGVTGLHRITQRAAEGGYAAMAVLLPANSSSLSLPEAQFIEKKLIKGVQVLHQQRSLRVDEYFLREIGDVGKDTTKQITVAAMLSSSSIQPKKAIEEIAQSVISKVGKQHSSCSSPVVKQLAALEVSSVPDVANGDIDEKELMTINFSKMITIKTKKIKGRSAKAIPFPNNIIAVKGSCVLLKSSDYVYSLKLSRSAVEGREVFDPSSELKTSISSPPRITLDWFNGNRC
jgi:hypothetical protein